MNKPLNEIYKKSFFGKRHKLSWRAKYVCDAIVRTFNLQESHSIIDVGCATGEYVAQFQEWGLFAEGIEGSSEAKEFFVADRIHIHDLREQLRLPSYFDVCMSLEVAEHIEPEHAAQYVCNLVSLSDKILITAAPPGQGGHYHVNCQEKGYWECMFFEHGYKRHHDKELAFRDKLTPVNHRREISAYIKNCMIFERHPYAIGDIK